jgi:SsrA-binding protein
VAKTPSDRQVVASNRRAYRDYDILDTYEGGLVLRGSEVKSLREGTVQLADAYARVRSNEMWVMGMHISPYTHSSGPFGHDPDRARKVLMHRHEIDRVRSRMDQDRLSLVPLSVYFRGGYAKIELGLARGRRQYDKRHAIRKRESDLEARRAMSLRRR